MDYFLSEVGLHVDKRAIIKSYNNFFLFNVGDVVAILFSKSGYYFLFEGICLEIQGKKFRSLDTNFTLCNVIAGVVVEICVSYYYHLCFMLKTINSRRKQVIPKRSKLHYLRNKLTKGGRSF